MQVVDGSLSDLASMGVSGVGAALVWKSFERATCIISVSLSEVPLLSQVSPFFFPFVLFLFVFRLLIFHLLFVLHLLFLLFVAVCTVCL